MTYELKRQVIFPDTPTGNSKKTEDCKNILNQNKEKLKTHSIHWATAILKSHWVNTWRSPSLGVGQPPCGSDNLTTACYPTRMPSCPSNSNILHWVVIYREVSLPCPSSDIFFFLVFIWLGRVLVAACRKYFADQRSNLRPLHWECGVLATGPPGKSQVLKSLSFFFFFFLIWSDIPF